MAEQRFTIPVHSFRNVETPFSKSGRRDYYAVVEVRHLPDLADWREVNVRDPKLTGSVPHAIEESLRGAPDTFLFMNRGLAIAVDSLSFDNAKSQLTIVLKEPKVHGLLDGGHTYAVIQEAQEELAFPQYVKVELLEGFSADEILSIVAARNTSNQVQEEGLLNLGNRFEGLKASLAKQHYAGLIAYKEYELLDPATGAPKPIDIRDVIAVLTCFDREHFDDATHPTVAYSSKAQCLRHFKAHPTSYEKLYPIADDLLRLSDLIYEQLPELYNSGKRDLEGMNGKFGALTGVAKHKGRRRTKLLFTGRESEYSVPSGFVFPILAAFRAFLREGPTGGYRWLEGVRPEKILESELGQKLALAVGEFALEQRNPSKTGKSASVWRSAFNEADKYAKDIEIKTLRSQIG